MRPTDGPAHARHDGVPAFRRAATGLPAGPISEVLTRRPGWPVDPPPESGVPAARAAADAPAWPTPRHSAVELPPAGTRVPAARNRYAHAPAEAAPVEVAPPSFPREPVPHRDVPAPLLRRRRHAAPERDVAPQDMVADTVPISGARHSRPEPGGPPSGPVVYELPETPPTGLRKFDLGTVPASVTPPRTWRKAAYFAVGTSAAVVLGLTVAAVELMGQPVNDEAMIDALPAYPTGPLTLPQLPYEKTTTNDAPGTDRDRPGTSTRRPSRSVTVPAPSRGEPPRDTVIGSTTGEGSEAPAEPTSEGSAITPTTAADGPTRRTVGPAPITPTDPSAMGDRTEQYFRLVTTDPAAAHAMTTGDMAREGTEGIEARYGGVERVEVQEITIDRNEAVTTSRVKVVHKDGTETIEHRKLTFTWGGDPKITAETVTA